MAGSFVGVGEAVQRGQLDCAGVGGQQSECAAGLDRGQLGGVAEQPDHRTGGLGVGDEPVEVAGAGHPGLVHHDHITGPQRVAVCWATSVAGGVVVQVLVQVVRRTAKVCGEDLRGLG